jgi:hypothetical protein
VYGHTSAWNSKSSPNASCVPNRLFNSVNGTENSIVSYLNTPNICASGTVAYYTTFSVGGTVYQNQTGCTLRSNGWIYVNKTSGGALPGKEYGHYAIRISNGIIAEKILVQP